MEGENSLSKEDAVRASQKVKICPKRSSHVHEKIRDVETEENYLLPEFDYGYGEDEDVDEDECEDEDKVGVDQINSHGKRLRCKGSSYCSSNAKSRTQKSKPKYPTAMCLAARKCVRDMTDGRQIITVDAHKKNLREDACRAIARWMYHAGVPLSAVKCDSFRVFIESIAEYGVGLEPPRLHEVSISFLKKEVKGIRNMIKSHAKEWARTGCSIMLDTVKNNRGKAVMNFLVNSHDGTFFIKSIDATGYVNCRERIFQLLDEMVERIGEGNVVQVVTDNVLAGRLLEVTREHLYWTPSAAHCIDSMLEDIGKLVVVNRTTRRAIALTGYIHNRTGMRNMMIRFTGQRLMVRPAITRSTTAFRTLCCLHQHKNGLMKMFTTENWTNSKWAKEQAGKKARRIALMPTFWSDIAHVLKLFAPLVRVFRMVCSEEKSPMGYIYEAMDKAKEEIAKSFEKEDEYKEVLKIIDSRWECQLHHPLHAAGYFLNPACFYSNPKIEKDDKVFTGLFKAIGRLVPSTEEQDKIIDQLQLYKESKGQFGNEFAIRHRKAFPPVEWWDAHGGSAPNLTKFATKILGLTCSSFGCERNWSVFEHVHYKTRNRLGQKRTNDVLFVKYNHALNRRYEMREYLDPISMRDIDESNEWLTGITDGDLDGEETDDELALEDFTWGSVARAPAVSSDYHHIATVSLPSKETSRKSNAASSSKGKAITEDVDGHGAETEETEEEEEEEEEDSEWEKLEEEEGKLWNV